ncbi:MAG: hypothetical protein J6I85_04670 [Clostridia bacterium]|nr:hypothetical protein [Clostridia bacterium]
MNKLSKILICIIILLLIVLGYLIYKVNYFKDGYIQAAEALCDHAKLLEDSGIKIISDENNKTEIHIKQSDKVIIEQ